MNDVSNRKQLSAASHKSTASYDSNADFATFISLNTVRSVPLRSIEQCLEQQRGIVMLADHDAILCGRHPLVVWCTDNEVVTKYTVNINEVPDRVATLIMHTSIESGETRVVLSSEEDTL
jgi:hypothetical protein